MHRRLNRLRQDERGMALIWVGLGFMGFMAATTLAVDVGMFMTARSQAQNAADAGALAGATALGYDDYDDRSPTGPAVRNALGGSRANLVMNEQVTITADDVEFPLGPTGLDNRVKVTVYRSAATETPNPVPTLMGVLFGVPTVNIVATATAEASPANAMTCVKPFIIPDRWREPSGTLATATDSFEMFNSRGQLLPNPDVYVPSGPNYTGYNNEADRGTRLTIRAGSGHNIEPTFYFSLALGGITGGSEYDWNIANCNTSIMHMGDIVIQEPGNMVGPTISGAELLVAKDPTAHWDTTRNTIVSPYSGQSPRVFPIPLYDPIHYAEGKKNGRFADFKVANWIGFFLETISGNQLIGRIIPIGGIVDENYPTPDTAFPMAIRLVE